MLGVPGIAGYSADRVVAEYGCAGRELRHVKAHDVEGAGGIESLTAHPEDGTIDVVMGNGDELAVTIEKDGSMTVESDEGTRTFNSAGAVLGAVSTSKAVDGSVEVTSESGATSSISSNGLTMTVESADGMSAVSTKTSSGVTVEVDGVTYTYDFASEEAQSDGGGAG